MSAVMNSDAGDVQAEEAGRTVREASIVGVDVAGDVNGVVAVAFRGRDELVTDDQQPMVVAGMSPSTVSPASPNDTGRPASASSTGLEAVTRGLDGE